MTSSSDKPTDAFPVVVIGGGLAGLTAALYLAERGIAPLVLEADALWPGGRLAGGEMEDFSYGGRKWAFRSTHGVHALWGGYPNMRQMLVEMLNVELRTSTGEDWIDRWGRAIRVVEAGTAIRYSWLPAPFHYLMLLLRPKFWSTISLLDFLSLPGFLVSMLLTVGVDPISENRPLGTAMMKDYFIGWTRNLRVTFVGLGRNLLAAPDEVISLGAFVAAVRFYTMLRRDAWFPEYFTGDSHQVIVKPAIERIENLGGMVMLGVEAEQISQAQAGWRLLVNDKRRGGMRSILANQVILAVEPPAAQRLFKASPMIKDEAENLRIPKALPCVTVRVWFDASPNSGAPSGMFTGDFPMDNFFWLHRLYDSFKEWHRETGGSALETHLYGKDHIFDLSDEAILVKIVSEILFVWPGLRGHFVYGTVRRNNAAQTVFEIPGEGYLHCQTPWEGITACGDWVGHALPVMNMERSVVTAIAAANIVLKSEGGETYTILEPKKPELLVRLIGGIVRGVRWLLGGMK